MNTASPELCQELYELTGKKWNFAKDPMTNHYWVDGYDVPQLQSHGGKGIPAYPLGYLARQLPFGTNLDIGKSSIGYVARYKGVEKYSKVADTPEDACAQLLITLIKQKVITP